MPGWHHMWDNIPRDVYESMPWWPPFLQDVRALTAFLRMDTYRQTLAARVEEMQQDADPIRRQPPNFAQWRWDTMHRVQRYMLALAVVLPEAWTADLFKNCKDGVNAANARRIASSAMFWERFHLVGELSEAVHHSGLGSGA